MKILSQIQDNCNKSTVPDIISTPVNGVRLTGGLLRQVFDDNRTFMKRLSFDAMLYWFDKKSGQSPDVQPYRGWFEDALKGQTASQYLMGAGNTLRWEMDEELASGAEIILDKLEKTAEADGFMMPIKQSEFANGEYPNYVRIWLTYGLGAAGLAGNSRAFELLRRWQDWFNSCDALPIVKHLHLAYQGIVASTWAYFLPLGIEEDIEVARTYYEESWRLAQFIRRESNAVAERRPQGDEPHAHGTELESFEGYLDLYRYTGTGYYLDAVLGAWEMYTRDWQHPGGGIVMCEFMDAWPGCGWITSAKPYNELCCSAFWIGLNQRLHRLFPDEERYVAEIEKSLYNVAIANQDGSESIRYFARMEGRKDPGRLNTCCCGVGTRLFGSLPEYIYSLSEDAVYVDMYADSVLEWTRSDAVVKLAMQTDMPFDSKVSLALSMDESEHFTLALRMPGWMAEMTPIMLNGSPIGTGTPGNYFKLERNWANGDTIEFSLPMAFRWREYKGADQIPGLNQRPALNVKRVSFEYGPLLYAVKGKQDYNDSILIWQEPENVNTWVRAADTPLEFGIEGRNELRFVPYFKLGDNETFTCFPVFPQPGYE